MKYSNTFKDSEERPFVTLDNIFFQSSTTPDCVISKKSPVIMASKRYKRTENKNN